MSGAKVSPYFLSFPRFLGVLSKITVTRNWKRRRKGTKFKLKTGKGSVKSFTDSKGLVHLPGDIIDLPASYKGEKWLQQVIADEPVVAAPTKVEQASSVGDPTIPEGEEAPKPEKKRKMKP